MVAPEVFVKVKPLTVTVTLFASVALNVTVSTSCTPAVADFETAAATAAVWLTVTAVVSVEPFTVTAL